MTPIVTIRASVLEDMAILSEFWYDRMALLQQTNSRIRFAPHARQKWEHAACDWLTQPDMLAFTGVLRDEIVGAIFAKCVPNAPGLLPEQIAQVVEIVIDMHTPQTQQGIGRYLLNALKTSLIERNMTQLQAQVSATSAVEQAFWRGMGAKNDDVMFWMIL